MDAKQLYQRIILDHAEHPRHYGTIDDADYQYQLHNPDCGDTITVFATITNNQITQVSFTGNGCIISKASASMMTSLMMNRSIDDAQLIMNAFQHLIMGDTVETNQLGDAVAFKTLSTFPTRVRCGALAWHALAAIIDEWRQANDSESSY